MQFQGNLFTSVQQVSRAQKRAEPRTQALLNKMTEAGAILHLQTRRAAVTAIFGTEEHETITNLSVTKRITSTDCCIRKSIFSQNHRRD